jgi:DNA-directed RNA polymerase delta subunit
LEGYKKRGKLKNLKNFQKQVVTNLNHLKEREKEILVLRFGLDGNPNTTLQFIGNKYDVTRERVRQIVNHIIKKLIKNPNTKLTELSNKIEKIIIENGGIIPEDTLIYIISPANVGIAVFGAVEVICLINPSINKIKKSNFTHNFWSVGKIKINKIIKTNKLIAEVLKSIKKPVLFNKLVYEINKLSKEKISPEFLKSLINGSKNFLTLENGKIGMSNWPEINPKNTKDKIYYILNQSKKPLHFKEITKKIQEIKFATKNPTQTTVHNELISDDRFVLIGRGIYALKKWGFAKGTILELLKLELKNNKKGLNQSEICNNILKKRMVSKNTIIMNLNSHKNFTKNEKGIWKLK